MQNISDITQNWAKTLGPLCQAPGQKKALQAFLQMGLPDQHLDAWAYTKTLGALGSMTPLYPETPSNQRGHTSTLQGRFGITLQDSRVIEYILPKEISYKKVEREQAENSFIDGLDTLHDLRPDAHTNLITVSKNADATTETLFVYLKESETAVGTITPARLKLEIAAHTQINLIFILSNVSRPGLSLSHVDLDLKENSYARVTIITNPSSNHLAFYRWRTFLKRDSHLESVVLATGAQPSRHEFEAHLLENGATASVQGLYLLKDKHHADIHTSIHHQAPYTTSSQLFKAVVQGEANGVYTGKVVIHPGAKGSNAAQKALGLLLSKQAHFSTRPQLEVYNDDVKCGHGAAVGQLGEDEAFYLASRGISPERTRQILLEAFVGEIVQNVSDPLAKIELEKAVKGQVI